MRKLLVPFFGLAATLTFAQETRQEVQFIGGASEFATFLAQNYRYPKAMLKANLNLKKKRYILRAGVYIK